MAATDKMGEPAVNAGVAGLRHIFANAEFNEISGVLTVAGEPVAVEPRPLRLLTELLRRVNEVVTKDELFETVWAGRATVDHVLANAVSKLRVALGEEAGARIVTLPRVGYRFNGPVRRVAADGVRHDLVAGQPVPGREGFLLDRPLGPPGRSQVWLARHAKLGQTHVFKFADDASRLSAIKREYTLYRLLQAELGPREDFARVLDTQFLASPYYLECEYGGMNLLEWADEGGRLAALSLQERLDVFLPIARAVAAAHSVGVIHKDLKPANVLMAPAQASGDPVRWQMRLTDFGSGRLLDPSRLEGLQLTAVGMTQAESVTAGSDGGTLMYLAPELLAGQSATVQSDVFALGLMLYQLLCGDLRRPLATGWQAGIDDELLVADITAATQGRHEDRLASVSELVARLADLPARRAARMRELEQTRLVGLALVAEAKRRSRRPWLIALLASLLLGLATSLWLYRQATTSLKEARAQEAKARAIGDFLTKDVLQSADVTNLGTKRTLLVGDMLARASESARTRFDGLPEVESQLRLVLGELHFKLSAFTEAEAEFRAARELLANPASPESKPLWLQAQYDHARALASLSKLDEASAILDGAERAVEGSSLATSPQLALASAAAKLTIYQGRQKYSDAIVAASTVMRLTDQLKPQDLAARFASKRVLASLQLREDKREEAEIVLKEIMAAPYSADTVGPILFARGQTMMARLLMMQKQLDQALELQKAARATLVERLGPDEVDVSNVSDEIGRNYIDRGMFDEAREAYTEAYRIRRMRLGDDFLGTRNAELNIALVDLSAQRSSRALEAIESLRPWYAARTGGERSPMTQTLDMYRLRALLDLGDVRRAEVLLPTLDPKLLNRAQANDWDLMLSAERGRLLVLQGKPSEAVALLRPALEVMREEKMPPPYIARYDRSLVRAMQQQTGLFKKATAR